MSEQDEVEQRAYFGLACFWKPDGQFGVRNGVKRTRVGYCGGSGPAPNYPTVYDHTEAVEVVYSPSALSYGDLLQLFWEFHDPCSCYKKRPQYMLAVFYTSEQQRKMAQESKERCEREIGKKMEASVLPLKTFHEAEGYHQKYFLRAYHRAFYEGLPKEDPVTSTRDARLNGFLSGNGSVEELKNNKYLLNLNEEQLQYVERHITGDQKPSTVMPYIRTVLQVAWNYIKVKIIGH